MKPPKPRFVVALDTEEPALQPRRGSGVIGMVSDPPLPGGMGVAQSAHTPPDGMANAIPLIRNLPVEVLDEILLHSLLDALSSKRHDIVQPLRLSHVCRYFRQVAFSNPRLWRWLELDDSRMKSEHHQTDMLGLWIRNSGACTFNATLRLREHPETFAQGALPILRGQTHRLKKLKLVLTDCAASVQIWSTFVRSPYLDYLKVTIDPPIDRALNHLALCSSVIGVVTSPNQRVASLPIALIPPSYAFSSPLTNLVYLKLLDTQWDKPATAAQVLDFLALCPRLLVLDYRGVEVDVIRTARHTVSLPELRTLSLNKTCISRDLISHLHLPMLQALHMHHLNVSFVGVDGFYEPGDSDDEAHDFSRSPYSDRLTGMMMRSLISRCAPPLRVLDFDYVDMRTKDFLWCFRHMPHLEEFRIVASDMSNTVVAALAEPDKDGNWPLPRLRHLVLRECNYIRGSIVAQAIIRRSAAGLVPTHYDLSHCQQINEISVHGILAAAGMKAVAGLTVFVEDVPPQVEEEDAVDLADVGVADD